MLLQLAGHETHKAHDGVEAIEAAERLRPDAVLLDIGLPRLNGYEVCRRIRERAVGKGPGAGRGDRLGQEEDRHRSQRSRIRRAHGQAGRPRRPHGVACFPAAGRRCQSSWPLTAPMSAATARLPESTMRGRDPNPGLRHCRRCSRSYSLVCPRASLELATNGSQVRAVTALNRPARLCVKAKMNAGPLLERR